MHCKLSASDFNGKREQETLKEKVLVIYFFFLHVKCLLDQQRRHLPVRTLALSLLVDLLIGKRWASNNIYFLRDIMRRIYIYILNPVDDLDRYMVMDSDSRYRN